LTASVHPSVGNLGKPRVRRRTTNIIYSYVRAVHGTADKRSWNLAAELFNPCKDLSTIACSFLGEDQIQGLQ
jgi:hypothetical protein